LGHHTHTVTDHSNIQDIKIGLSTTLAILMHETPHEIGDFAYLIKKKYSLFGILATQLLTSLGCLAGAFVGTPFLISIKASTGAKFIRRNCSV
jgi:zinc transporter ZupT